MLFPVAWLRLLISSILLLALSPIVHAREESLCTHQSFSPFFTFISIFITSHVLCNILHSSRVFVNSTFRCRIYRKEPVYNIQYICSQRGMSFVCLLYFALHGLPPG